MDQENLVREIKMTFEALYMPVALSKQRYSGEDFMEVAIEIMREAKRNNVFDLHKELIASTLIDEFNNKLNPKLEEDQKQTFMKVLTGRSMLIKI